MRKIAELWRKIRFRTIWRELMRAYEMDHDMPIYAYVRRDQSNGDTKLSRFEVVTAFVGDNALVLECAEDPDENVIRRLEAELEDLNGKIKRLNAFIEKHYDGWGFIGDMDGDNYEAQHMALESQLSHMISYARALEWRLEILRGIRGPVNVEI